MKQSSVDGISIILSVKIWSFSLVNLPFKRAMLRCSLVKKWKISK
jgi:hypothetical protein